MHCGISIEDFATSSNEIHDETTHYDLRGDLIEYFWELKGAST